MFLSPAVIQSPSMNNIGPVGINSTGQQRNPIDIVLCLKKIHIQMI